MRYVNLNSTFSILGKRWCWYSDLHGGRHAGNAFLSPFNEKNNENLKSNNKEELC
jgi:hypothetical protein